MREHAVHHRLHRDGAVHPASLETTLTVDEIEGLKRNLLDSQEEPAAAEDGIASGATQMSRWIRTEGERLGRRLAREPMR